MVHRMIRTATAGAALLFSALAVTSPTPVTAQEMETDAHVTFVNESLEEVRVFAFSDNIQDRTMVGWVGGNEVEYIRIPEEARDNDGTFRIAVQKVLPLPQLGVPATPHPLIPTPALDPEPVTDLRIVLDDQMGLVFAEISPESGDS